VVEAKANLEELLMEHRQLVKAIEETKEILKQPRPAAGSESSHDWGSTMARQLTRLHERVSRHFRAEEGSEFLEDISPKRPHVARSFETLQQEHARILGDLRSLQEAALIYSEGKEPDEPRLRRRTLAVLDRLAHHEHAETELLQRALYEDRGAAD
jgi:hypothetical protein